MTRKCKWCNHYQGIVAFQFQAGDRLLRAEGTITPHPDNNDHIFNGLTIDDPANREVVTLHIQQTPHQAG